MALLETRTLYRLCGLRGFAVAKTAQMPFHVVAQSPHFETTCYFINSKDSSRNVIMNSACELFHRIRPKTVPSIWAWAVFGIGFTVELILLSKTADPIYKEGGRLTIFTFTFLTWWWLSISFLSWKLVCWTLKGADEPNSSPSTLRLLLLSLTTVAVVSCYAISWGLYVQAGRFANFEVIKFTAANTYDLWLYLSQAEPIHLVRITAIALPLLVAIPLFAKKYGGVIVRHETPKDRRSLWILATVFMLLAATALLRDPSPRRRFARMGLVRNSLNPLVTLATSLAETFTRDAIEPRLSEQELLPLSTPWQPPTEGKRPPIIVVAIESLRSDVLHYVHKGQEVTPNLNRLAKAGVEWTRAYSQSTHSDYADVCIVSSLYPLRSRMHHYYSKNDPWPKTRIYDILKPAGYKTAIISSQNEAWGRMEEFLDSENLDFFYHPQRCPTKGLDMKAKKDLGFYLEIETGALQAGKFPDKHTADVAIEWIRQRADEEQPFFLSMNLQSSHFPFLMPDDVPRPFQPCELGDKVRFMVFPKSETETVKNAYYNAVHETDRQLGRLVDSLEELNLLDEAILLVIGENGEAFHENGSCGHGREPVEPAIFVATVMHSPAHVQPSIEDYPLEHIDLMPTVLGMMGWPAHPNFQGIDALSENRTPLSERLLYFHVLSPSARADAVQFAGRWKYQINHTTSETSLFDLHNDPTESLDISQQKPEMAQKLHQLLVEWRERQLAYYHFPEYYTRFYPPRSPKVRPVEDGVAVGNDESQDDSDS